jgi:hypothetical protein
MNQRTRKQKLEVARRLFDYLFLLRYGREPEDWEQVLGRAFVTGALQVVRPPALCAGASVIDDNALARVYYVAEDVARALSLVERSAGQPLIACDSLK